MSLTQTILPTSPAGTSARRRRSRRALAVGAVAVIAAIAMPSAALAGGKGTRPHTSGSGATGFGLVSESQGNNPNSPSWCMNEDDYDQRVFSGSLSGTVSASQQLCGLDSDFYNNVYWSAGGIGVEADVYVVGQLSDLTITSPSGDAHHAVLMGSSTDKGTTTYHYAACYVPSYAAATDTGGTPLPGGTWQVNLSGQMSSARLSINSQMTDVRYQQAHCPVSEQNIT